MANVDNVRTFQEYVDRNATATRTSYKGVAQGIYNDLLTATNKLNAGTLQ